MTAVTRLGSLEIHEEIGIGGFSVVHRARLAPMKVDFAVKFLRPSSFHTDLDAVTQRFYREAELLVRLRHDFITPMFGFGEHEGEPYILMEYFKGRDLYRAREAQRHPPEPNKVLAFFKRVANALKYAHSKGVVHRDLKPSNLLVDMQGKQDARVIDFGIAAIMDPQGARLTRTGHEVAGDAFSAPEVIENPKHISATADVFSLGACWYWLLTGTAPSGRDWEARLRSIDGVDSRYEAVLLKTLSSVGERYVGMSELIADMAALESSDGLVAAKKFKLDDNAIIVLGTISAKCIGDDETMNRYGLEREIAGVIDGLSLKLALRRLVGRGFLDAKTHIDWDGDEVLTYRPTEEGDRWVDMHEDEVQKLLVQQNSPKAPVVGGFYDDDLPF